MHTKGQKSWKHVAKPKPKSRFRQRMESESPGPTTRESLIADLGKPGETYQNASDLRPNEGNTYSGSDKEQAIDGIDAVSQRVQHLGKKSPKAFRVLADVMHNPKLHSRGGRMFLRQRQRLDKIAKENSPEHADDSRKQQTIIFTEEDARITPWSLAAASPSAVRYITSKETQSQQKKPHLRLHTLGNLPQPPELWRSKVEKNYTPRSRQKEMYVSQKPPTRHLSERSRSRSEQENFDALGVAFPADMLRNDAKIIASSYGRRGKVIRPGYIETDFNARAKGWTKVF